jgi:predicted nucleic acid-binding protein
VDGLEAIFADRILPINAAIARRWGEISGERPLPVIDTLIAATAIDHGLTLVTRNIRDVESSGAALLNPWVLD